MDACDYYKTMSFLQLSLKGVAFEVTVPGNREMCVGKKYREEKQQNDLAREGVS